MQTMKPKLAPWQKTILRGLTAAALRLPVFPRKRGMTPFTALVLMACRAKKNRTTLTVCRHDIEACRENDRELTAEICARIAQQAKCDWLYDEAEDKGKFFEGN